jgi:hypothetical protein
MKKIFKKVNKFLEPFMTKLFLVQTTIILFIVYYFILGPIAILSKLFSKSFFESKSNDRSSWKPRKNINNSLKNARRLY